MAAPWRDSDYKDRSPLEYRVYVGNLPYSVDEQTLMDYFADYGAISAEVPCSCSCFPFRSLPVNWVVSFVLR